MKKLSILSYILIVILACNLVGCNDSMDSAFSQVRGFFYSDCGRDSYKVNQTDDGKVRTFIITCNR